MEVKEVIMLVKIEIGCCNTIVLRIEALGVDVKVKGSLPSDYMERLNKALRELKRDMERLERIRRKIREVFKKHFEIKLDPF